MFKSLRVFVSCLLLLGVSTSLTVNSPAQIKPVYDQGALGLVRQLKRLNTSASAMMIGAHPDDEDTALLSYLSRGENARTAYLSLTRGDGGQNIIGPELGEALGVIRTEELIQARKLDGAEQYFTRAYDYGFSKTLQEARLKWDENVILCDTVRAIRQFRPLVVVAQFSGTPADGHGHHQFAGYIAPRAVKAAADASQCGGESGAVWAVKKFYVRHRGQGEPRLRVNTGKYDPLYGRSYFEIAMEARSQHKSQEQGVLELRGDQYSSLNLQGSEARESGIFEGLDVSVAAAGTGQVDPGKALAEVQDAAERALREYDPRTPERILPHLINGYKAATRKGQFTAPNPPTEVFAREMRTRFADAIVAVLGLQIDALSDVETIAQGESFNVGVKAYWPNREGVTIKGLSLAVPLKPGIPSIANRSDLQWWSVRRVPAPTSNTPGFLTREAGMAAEYFAVTVPPDADLTTPYWLVEPRPGDMYVMSGHRGVHGSPFQPPVPKALVTLEVNGETLYVERPVEFRYADDVRGEIRRNVAVVPTITVGLDQNLMIIAAGAKATEKQLAVTVTSNSSGAVSGKVALDLPAGWTAASDSSELNLTRKGESGSVQFKIRVPANARPGTYTLKATATIGDKSFSRSVRTLSYPHIQTHRFYNDAAVKANVIDLKTRPVKIGYIPGSGDSLPQAIAQMGLSIETIDERTLAAGDLSRFDTILVGIRAYQVRTDIVAHNKRLLEFAEKGGTLVVQYQLSGYTQQGLAPFPARQGPRVADETAKVTILDPSHPIFNVPNKITDADFAGWVQERNLYNFSTMDPKYKGLLEAHDVNEAENAGGLVVADIGRGRYVYCSYSLFRQLPAGVPGAYRLLANILAFNGEVRGPAAK
ncbi:MAG: PIG-L family deacetylase [Chloracidobacterium sp.]|nr:PIG-L family deacetylase [Chloracidobacterium sp.]